MARSMFYALAVFAAASLVTAGDDQQALAPDKPAAEQPPADKAAAEKPAEKPAAPAADDKPAVTIKDELRSLRVCNAYTASNGLDMVFVRTGKSLGHMSYKACKDFQLPLQKGDHIDFEIPGGASSNLTDVGKFAVSEIPVGAGALLLVVRRTASKTTPAKFMSHAFAVADGSGGQAQIAVIDAFQGDGSDARKLKIMDADANSTDSEDLPTNSALALSPGKYKIGLDKSDAATFELLDAKANSSYVVMRVGAAANDGDNSTEFSESLVVFPGHEMKSGASAYASVWSLLALLLARFAL